MQNLLSINWLVPGIAHKIDFSKSIRGSLRGMPRRILLIGHKLDSSDTTTVTLPVSPWVQEIPSSSSPGSMPLLHVTQVSTETDALTMAGEGSMLMAMWRAAKANTAPGLPIDMIAVEPNGSAAAATSVIVLSNAGTYLQNSGEVMIYIGGVRISVGVTTSDTTATVVTKLIAAINAETYLPVAASAVAAADQFQLTCRWGGLTGNMIDLRSSYYADDLLPAGFAMTIPAMAGGTTAPDMTALVTALAAYRATELVVPFTDNTSLNVLETELAARWNFANMQDGQVVTVMRGNQGAVTTWLDGRNSDQGHTIAVTKDCTNPWETAAMAAAAIESSAVIDPALPYTDIQLVGYVGPKRGEHWSADQANALLLDGGSPLAVDMEGKGYLSRVVTNYTHNPSGTVDASKRELAWIKTMSYYRWYVVSEFALNYRGFKLAEYITDPIPGQKIMAAELGEEIMIGLYTQLQNAGMVQNIEYYKQTLLVEIDGPNGRLKIQDEPVILTQHYQTELTSYVVAGHVA